MVGYATVLAVNNTWTLEDLGGAILLSTEGTVSPATLELAVAIGIALAREFAAG